MLSPAIIVTVSLVLVAAIGYVIGLLRGRRLSAQERAEGARRRLAEADLEEARDAQQRQRARLDEADAARVILADECNALRADLESTRTEADGTVRQLELRDDQLRHARVQMDTTTAALAESRMGDERRTNDAVVQLEAHLHERDVRIERLRADLGELEERYAKQVQDRDTELANMRRSTDDRAIETEELRTDVSRARAQLEERREELGTARSAVGRAQAQQRHLEGDLARVRDELDAMRLALADARRETAELEQGYSAQIEQRAAHIDELQAARQRSEERGAELQDQLQDRSRKLEEALTARGEVERQAGERERLSETLHGELNVALQHAESERVATNAVLAEVTAVGQRADADLQSVRIEIEETAEGLRETEAAFVRLQHRHAELGEETERKLNERALEVDHLTRTIASRTAELERTQTAVETVTTRGEAIEQALEAEGARTHTAQATLAAQEEALQETRDELSRQVVALEAARAELVDAESRGERRLRERTLEAERVTTLLRSREEELEQTGKLAAALHQRVAEEEARCDTRDQRITVLEREQQRLFDVRDRLLREVHDREQEIRQLRALMHGTAQDQDDLEMIDGIGPSIATLLQSLGVRSFRQIAAWDPLTMGWLADREPQLRGRLRTEWIEAARKAHDDKYDQPPD